MILVDTSVWVDHFRRGNGRFSLLLRNDAVLTHPMVIGELACGNLRNRDEILGHLASLRQVTVASHDEVLAFIKTHRIHGRGLGLIDVHLLASALIDRRPLWTLDTALAEAARRLGCSA
jgi:predicted nucleic acid-binding protein